MATNQLVIGLVGFGVVGEGLYRVLNQTPSLSARIKKIAIRDPAKRRNAPAALFTTDVNELLNDRDINVIVEVIDDTEAAYQIVSTALKNGKQVVSASKKMLALHLPELLELQQTTGASLLYEAAACASIPVIRNLEEYYDNDLLQGLRGIVNGSTNYILTRIKEDGLDFREALLGAQQLGFAESDPRLDVEGWDALYKWILLLAHGYGLVLKPEELLLHGITHLHPGDTAFAAARDQEIKLVAFARKLENQQVAAFVLPQLVEKNDPLSLVKNEYNGVVLESQFADRQFFSGKGAGSFPTASAVLSDLAALRYGYRYEYKKLNGPVPHRLNNDLLLRVYISCNDLRSLPREQLEWIDEWHAGEQRQYLVGAIRLTVLLRESWWKDPGVSLVLLPDPVVEDAGVRELKKRSLELAGVF